MTDATEGRIASFTNGQDGPSLEPISESSSDHGMEAVKDITCGSIAGIIGKIVEYPFDTVKVRLQSQPDTLPLRYQGPLDCFRQSLRVEGVTGLYRGISAPLVGAAIETSSLFFSYRIAQNALRAAIFSSTSHDSLPLSALIASGGASGAFTSLILTPIELVKCQMQVPLSSARVQAPGPLSIIASIFRYHGILGLWHGQFGTLIRETGGSAAWFGSYEGVNALFRKYNAREPPSITEAAKRDPLPLYQQMIAGASAGISYNFIFFPADTIKSRMQTEEVNTSGLVRKTFWTSGKALWQQQGIRGMYRGCGITVGRAAPSSAFIFAVYEGLIRWWE